MKTRKAAKLIAGMLLVYIAITLGGCAGTVSPEVKVVAEEGVSLSAVNNAQQAVNNTLYYYWNVYKVRLNKSVKVFLVKDSDQYIRVQRRELTTPLPEAEYMAKTTSGLFANNIIIVEDARLGDEYNATILIGHELTHAFQEQIGKKNDQELQWLKEGTADVIAANIAEQNRSSTQAGLYRRYYQKQYEKYQLHPTLAELESYEGFRIAGDKYNGTNYTVATIAVFFLADRSGSDTLFKYYMLRGQNKSVAAAFSEAYSISLDEYKDWYTSCVR